MDDNIHVPAEIKSTETKKKKTLKEVIVTNSYDFASVMSAAVITIMIIFTFIFRFVGVIGSSMVPTLHDSDWLVVTAYDHNPTRGQVIIITQPNTFNEPIVKRIIATENQTVDINFSTGEVFVDGEKLDEPYINNATTDQYDVAFPLVVPEGCVFVMGDNRQHSSDSRQTIIGFIDENYILGSVKYKVIEADESGQMKFVSFSDWRVN